MTNEFYKLLLNEKWVWKKWDGPKQLEDKKTQSLMMLPYVAVRLAFPDVGADERSPCDRTDYVLIQDKTFKKWTKAYADDEELWFKEYVVVPLT